MERLPDELWICTFRYLHPIDILYSFNNLNTRIQQIIGPYQNKIVLHNASFRHFRLFCLKLLPIQNVVQNIHTIILKNGQEMQLYCKYICPIPNLQCLKLVSCDPWIHESELEFNPELFTKFPNLTNLHIETLKTLSVEKLVETIALKAPATLRNLTLLCACTFWFTKTNGAQLPNVKLLIVHVEKLTHLFNLLQVMNNIEELHFSIRNLDDFEDTKVPNTLRKLHIEFGSYHQFNAENTQSHDFQTLENLLLLLPKQLESLTLIAMTNDKHFSDMNKLNALKNIFPHLNSFQYFIQTSHCPSDEINEVYRLPDSTYILQTNPRVVSFGSELRNGVKYLTNDYHIACQRVSNLTQHQLYNSTVLLLTDQSLALGYTFKQLLQLRKICYHFSKSYDSGEAALQKIKQLTELLARAPNLNYAHFEANTSQAMIEKLKQMTTINANALKKISHLQCKCSNFMKTEFHCSFLIELAQIMPHLKYLYLRSFHSLTSDEILSPKLAIDHVQQYFKDIINLILRVRRINIRGVDELEKQLQQWRYENDQRILYNARYRSFTEDTSDFDAPFDFISIWF